MKTICCGYVKVDHTRFVCGKLIKDGEDDKRGVSHGICLECFKAWKNEWRGKLKEWRDAK